MIGLTALVLGVILGWSSERQIGNLWRMIFGPPIWVTVSRSCNAGQSHCIFIRREMQETLYADDQFFVFWSPEEATRNLLSWSKGHGRIECDPGLDPEISWLSPTEVRLAPGGVIGCRLLGDGPKGITVTIAP